MGAALLGIVNNAPGTASPIPGLLAPFAFNDPKKVVLALVIGAAGGILAGVVGGMVFKKRFGMEPVKEAAEEILEGAETGNKTVPDSGM